MIIDEAFYFPVQEFIQRWGVLEDSPVELVGDPGDGTTIDLDEPFLLRWNHSRMCMLSKIQGSDATTTGGL